MKVEIPGIEVEGTLLPNGKNAVDVDWLWELGK